MSFEMRSTAELVQIAVAGGGFRLDAGMRSTAELVQIAAAGAGRRARITFAGLNVRSTAELVQIAAAGNGSVVLEG